MTRHNICIVGEKRSPQPGGMVRDALEEAAKRFERMMEMGTEAMEMEAGTSTILRKTAEELKTLGTVVRNGPQLEGVDQVNIGKAMQRIADIILIESVRVKAMKSAYEDLSGLRERVKAIEDTLEMRTWSGESDIIGRFLDVEDRLRTPTAPDGEEG